MITHLSILLIGFSIFSAIILLSAYLFSLPDMRKSIQSKIAASVLLFCIMILQAGHYCYFSESIPVLEHRIYTSVLLTVPVAFFFFSQVVLFPDVDYQKRDLIHFIAPLLSLILPITILPLIGFLFGTAYTFWFARLIFKLREQRQRFKFEMFFFGLFAVIALVALLLCLSLPYLDPVIFYTVYSNVISGSLLLIVAALIFFPQLLNDILLITEIAYSKSKLVGINTRAKLDQLEQLMLVEKVYQNEELSLTSLAEQLDLSSHQLSELINTEFDYGFPRYIREYRVREAKKLLVSEPSASILSISMMTGFKSQSNFYTAFKGITNQSPGSYRKAHC